MGNNYDGKIPKYDGGKSNVNLYLDLNEVNVGINFSYDSFNSDSPKDDFIVNKKAVQFKK